MIYSGILLLISLNIIVLKMTKEIFLSPVSLIVLVNMILFFVIYFLNIVVNFKKI